MRPIEELNNDVKTFLLATSNLLTRYMGGESEIKMMVGHKTTATLSFAGGRVTRETIEDVLAHLAFYKRYFPKADEPTGELDTPEKIIKALQITWGSRVEDNSITEAHDEG